MDAFTITEMHYSMVSLFCDLVWPLYLFALAELSSMTALTFQRLYKVSIISQVCTVALSKCTRIKRKLGMGVMMAFVLP